MVKGKDLEVVIGNSMTSMLGLFRELTDYEEQQAVGTGGGGGGGGGSGSGGPTVSACSPNGTLCPGNNCHGCTINDSISPA